MEFVSPYTLSYETSESAGFDIKSLETVMLEPGKQVTVKTGIYVVPGSARHIELMGLEIIEHLEVRPRSGLANRNGITVLNSPGTVDADYPDEVGVILYNASDKHYVVQKGARIAQGVITLAVTGENVPRSDAQRTGGFGSTGNS